MHRLTSLIAALVHIVLEFSISLIIRTQSLLFPRARAKVDLFLITPKFQNMISADRTDRIFCHGQSKFLERRLFFFVKDIISFLLSMLNLSEEAFIFYRVY